MGTRLCRGIGCLALAFVVAIDVGPFVRPLWSQENPDFSGPQVGEKLPGFEVRGVLGPDSDARYNPLAKAESKPTVIVFVHQVTRPSLQLTRAVMDYVVKRSKDGVTGTVVLLTSDVTDTENWVKRAARALPAGVPVGIYTEGVEGPGAYGLNRNVTLTVLVGKDQRVTANFALVQPSLQADGLKIATQISAALGDAQPPIAADLGLANDRPAREMANFDLRSLLQPVIRRDATDEEVDTAAKKVETFVATNEAARLRIGQITRQIIDNGKLENYGTARCQTWLRKWSQEFVPAKDSPQPSKRQESNDEN